MSTHGILKALLVAPLLTAGLTAVTAALVAGKHHRFGATATEYRASLPGDGLLPEAQVQNDRACTILAPPSAVWPWIAQLGQDKAGFYSFEFLENLAGCQITGATQIHPEWQNPAVDDAFPLHPDLALRVAEVEPGRYLVATSQGGAAPGEMDFAMTWTFYLTSTAGPAGEQATRLHVRERYAAGNGSTRRMVDALSVVSAIMTWRMMSRLKTLCTQDADGAAGA